MNETKHGNTQPIQHAERERGKPTGGQTDGEQVGERKTAAVNDRPGEKKAKEQQSVALYPIITGQESQINLASAIQGLNTTLEFITKYREEPHNPWNKKEPPPK